MATRKYIFSITLTVFRNEVRTIDEFFHIHINTYRQTATMTDYDYDIFQRYDLKRGKRMVVEGVDREIPPFCKKLISRANGV